MTESDHIESGDEKVDMTQNLAKKKKRRTILFVAALLHMWSSVFDGEKVLRLVIFWRINKYYCCRSDKCKKCRN